MKKDKRKLYRSVEKGTKKGGQGAALANRQSYYIISLPTLSSYGHANTAFDARTKTLIDKGEQKNGE